MNVLRAILLKLVSAFLLAVMSALVRFLGEKYPVGIRVLGAVALFASMTNIISGFMITDRMLKMFKPAGARKAESGSGGAAKGEGSAGA